MSDAVFAGVLAVAYEPKLIGKERYNRMLDCVSGQAAFKIAQEANFGQGATELKTASDNETNALADLIKNQCPFVELKEYFLSRYDFLNAEALIKSKYLKLDTSTMTNSFGLIDVNTLAQWIKDGEYEELDPSLKTALQNADKMFAEGNADGFLINNLFVKAHYNYLKQKVKMPLLKESIAKKIDYVNLIAAFRASDEKLIDEMFIEGGKLSLARIKQIAEMSYDAVKNEFIFDDMRDFLEKIFADAKEGRPLIVSEKESDSFLLRRLKEERFDLNNEKQFLLYCLYKQNEITNVNIIVVGLNSGLDKGML
jgi:hypothetical protein